MPHVEMATGSSYLVYEAALYKNLFTLLFSITGFIFFPHVTIQRAGLAQFINAEISPHFQLYSAYNHTDRPTLAVDHSIPGFARLKKAIESRITT